MKMRIKIYMVAAIAAFFVSLQTGECATTTVMVGSGGLRFSPTNVVISTGDSVVWQWINTTPHSTTSGTNGVHGDDNGVPSGLWDTALISTPGTTFTNTFPSAGTFNYYCSLHFSEGMTGQVVVASAPTTVMVGSGGLRFSPTNVVISTGQSVIWQWINTTPHSTTSGTNGVHGDDNGVPSGLWDTGLISTPGTTFTNTFPSAGTFNYYCSLHFSEGMTGQVLVVGAAAPPTVAISSPSAGTVFAAPANVTIQAVVTNGSGTVTNVQFLANAVVLGNVKTAPFSTVAGNLAAGNYTLTAIALDNNDLSATNSVAISVVTPVALFLSNSSKSGTGFQFSYPANTGLHYIIQRSMDFNTWVTLETNTAVSNPTVFLDANATNGFNFYRVGRMPNP